MLEIVVKTDSSLELEERALIQIGDFAIDVTMAKQ